MKNLKKVVFISFFVLLILIVAYFLVRLIPKKDKLAGEVYFDAACDVPFSEIKIQKGKEEPFVVRNDKGFKIDGLEKIPLNMMLLDYLFSCFEKINADHIFYPKEKLEEYGLKEPSFIFDVKTKDSGIRVEVGKKTIDEEGYYVLAKFVDDKTTRPIAVVNSKRLDPILIDKKGYVDLKLVKDFKKTFDEDNVYNKDGLQSCTVTKKGVKTKLEFEANEKGDVVLKSPKDFKFDEQAKNIIEKGPNMLCATEVLTLNPDEKEMEKCGFNSPNYVVKYSIDNENYEIKIGNLYKAEQVPGYDEKKENVDTIKYYYVAIKGVNAIYSVVESSLPWMELKIK